MTDNYVARLGQICCGLSAIATPAILTVKAAQAAPSNTTDKLVALDNAAPLTDAAMAAAIPSPETPPPTTASPAAAPIVETVTAPSFSDPSATMPEPTVTPAAIADQNTADPPQSASIVPLDTPPARIPIEANTPTSITPRQIPDKAKGTPQQPKPANPITAIAPLEAFPPPAADLATPLADSAAPKTAAPDTGPDTPAPTPTALGTISPTTLPIAPLASSPPPTVLPPTETPQDTSSQITPAASPAPGKTTPTTAADLNNGAPVTLSSDPSSPITPRYDLTLSAAELTAADPSLANRHERPLPDRLDQAGLTISGLRTDTETGQFDLDYPATTGQSGGQAKTTRYIANAYYDVPTQTAIQPYVGAGIGYATIALRPNTPTVARTHETRFAYQLRAGVRYSATPNLTVNLGYRYFAIAGLMQLGAQQQTIAASAIEIGLQARF
ncbi:MAG: outer membrane beta-barrel protein [Cyanobacteria bacterium P01_A01_bin.105]